MNNLSVWLVTLGAIYWLSPVAAGTLYKWVDQEGNQHFSQTPPQDQASQRFNKQAVRENLKGDAKCCLEAKNLAVEYASLIGKGADFATINKLLTGVPYGQELGNHIANEAKLKFGVADIAERTYSTCMNAGFSFCRSASGSGAIATGTSQGTGFFVNGSGSVVTNQHLVDGCKTFELPEHPTAKVQLAASDKAMDLAVLNTGITPKLAATLQKSAVKLGQNVLAVGYGLEAISAGIKVTAGNVSALKGLNNELHSFQISASLAPGNSGGPILDSNGYVLGVAVAKLNPTYALTHAADNVNFAIRADAVKIFLDAQNVEYALATTDVPKQPEVITEEARSYTLLIKCHH